MPGCGMDGPSTCGAAAIPRSMHTSAAKVGTAAKSTARRNVMTVPAPAPAAVGEEREGFVDAGAVACALEDGVPGDLLVLEPPLAL
jgi:hypothetical protein